MTTQIGQCCIGLAASLPAAIYTFIPALKDVAVLA
jgi:hypothetical protein